MRRRSLQVFVVVAQDAVCTALLLVLMEPFALPEATRRAKPPTPQMRLLPNLWTSIESRSDILNPQETLDIVTRPGSLVALPSDEVCVKACCWQTAVGGVLGPLTPSSDFTSTGGSICLVPSDCLLSLRCTTIFGRLHRVLAAGGRQVVGSRVPFETQEGLRPLRRGCAGAGPFAASVA